MKAEEIVKALRSCSEMDCANCPAGLELPLTGPTCFERLLPEAAGALEKLLDRCARYAEEIAVLQERQRWIPVTERLPENEKDVLIAFTRKGLNGDIYRCVGMAFHTDGKTTTEDTSYSWELDNVDMEYDEKNDAYIIPEGWWETVNFAENFTAVDMRVTHWMPLPEAPEVE